MPGSKSLGSFESPSFERRGGSISDGVVIDRNTAAGWCSRRKGDEPSQCVGNATPRERGESIRFPHLIGLDRRQFDRICPPFFPKTRAARALSFDCGDREPRRGMDFSPGAPLLRSRARVPRGPIASWLAFGTGSSRSRPRGSLRFRGCPGRRSARSVGTLLACFYRCRW